MAAPSPGRSPRRRSTSLQNGLVAEWNSMKTVAPPRPTTPETAIPARSSAASPGPPAGRALCLELQLLRPRPRDVPDSPSLEFSATQSFSLTTWVYVPSLPGQWSGIVTKSRVQRELVRNLDQSIEPMGWAAAARATRRLQWTVRHHRLEPGHTGPEWIGGDAGSLRGRRRRWPADRPSQSNGTGTLIGGD